MYENMPKEIQNLLFLIRCNVNKARNEYGFENQDNIYIRESLGHWEMLINYVKEKSREGRKKE